MTQTTHTNIRRAIAREAGWIAGLDNELRKCPHTYIVDEALWLAGYDEGHDRVVKSDKTLALYGISR